MSHIHRAACLFALIVFSTFATAQDRKEAPPPLGTASFIPPEGNTKLQPLTPENFVTRAAVTNLAEIDLSQMALDKSTNADIRKFATQIIKDHQAAQAKLKQIAGAQKIALPGSVDEERRKQREQLKELTGADFEKQYVALMHTGHNEAAGFLEAATKSNELDSAFKNYASETLQTVRNHRAEAAKLQASH
jgi:putative membrane protein